MSRWLDKDKDGNPVEEIADANQCRWLINEVCCNDDSDCVADFPYEDDCNNCPYFTQEEFEV